MLLFNPEPEAAVSDGTTGVELHVLFRTIS